MVFIDRGRGFFNAGTGKITDGFNAELKEHKLIAFMGDNAAQQPGSLQETMLHETAVAWIRLGLACTSPAMPGEETSEDFSARMQKMAQKINEEYDVDGLCRDLPTRLEALCNAGGGSCVSDRLSHGGCISTCKST